MTAPTIAMRMPRKSRLTADQQKHQHVCWDTRTLRNLSLSMRGAKKQFAMRANCHGSDSRFGCSMMKAYMLTVPKGATTEAGAKA